MKLIKIYFWKNLSIGSCSWLNDLQLDSHSWPLYTLLLAFSLTFSCFMTLNLLVPYFWLLALLLAVFFFFQSQSIDISSIVWCFWNVLVRRTFVILSASISRPGIYLIVTFFLLTNSWTLSRFQRNIFNLGS